MDIEEMLIQLKEIINKRQILYGSPKIYLSQVASLWNAYLKTRYPGFPDTLDSRDVAILMILFKINRVIREPSAIDGWQDIAGYAACGASANQAE